MTKLKTKKQTKGKPLLGGFPWFAWLAIVLVIAGIVVFARIYPINQPSSDNSEGPKAAIIDQLYAFGYPNQEFINEITHTLEAYGFKVDLYQGKEVTVDLYGKLPNYGYKLIIFRVHSGLIAAQGKAMKTSISTSEPFTQTKYIKEQLNHELVMARVGEGEPFYFAIDSKFIADRMRGRFDDTVIILAGCSCLLLQDLARAFIDKGASCYIAWDRTVELDYLDEASAYLVEQLCQPNISIEEAVTNTMTEKGPDPKYKAILKFYPLQSGDRTLKELV